MSESTRSSIAEELKQGKTVAYFTVGVSMRPLLTERKTHVMIAPLQEGNVGDILLYVRDNGAQVLHRCLKKDEKIYYMRGDNTCGLEPIKKAQAIGVVTHIYRKGRTFDVRESKAYGAYVTLWRWLYPFRWVLFQMKNVARRFKCLVK